MRLSIVAAMAAVACCFWPGVSGAADLEDVTVVRQEPIGEPSIHVVRHHRARTYSDACGPCGYHRRRHYHAYWRVPTYRVDQYRTYIGVAGYPKFYGVPYDDEDFDFYGHYPYRINGGFWRPHAGFAIGY